MKKRIIAILTGLALPAALCFGQSQEHIDVSAYVNDYSRPLKEVLADVSKQFGVEIHTNIVPDSLMVSFADYRIRPWDLEQTLEALLWPFGYIAQWNSGYGTPSYSVSKFTHARRSPSEGKAILDYLGAKYNDQASWEERKAILRSDMRHYSGLDKMAAHFDGQVLLSKKRNYKEYSVQNMAMEILPGLYCFGAIYWPAKTPKGACPLIINPHGHNDFGHGQDAEQLRCAMEARMGCIAISYSMFCYGPTPQFADAYHKTGVAQSYNLLCAERLLDFGLTFKEVDHSRVGISGYSGGGSQTMFITAMDDRITLAVPVVMMSSFFAGGCECESGTRLPLSGGGTCNAEIVSMCAPRPMLLISDGADWTALNTELEVPFVKRIYGFFGEEDKVEHVHFPMGEHDYNKDKRNAMYDFVSRQWNLDTSKVLKADGSFDESACVVESLDMLSIWNSYEKPAGFITDFDDVIRVMNWVKNAE